MKDFFEMTSTCMQGGFPRSLGGFQTPNLKIGPHSPPMAWQYPPVIQKQQPMTMEERNDSGINSGSDCQSSSPGSENGAEGFSSPTRTSQSKMSYYSTPIYQREQPYQTSNLTTPIFNRASLCSTSPSVSSPTNVKTEPEDFEVKEDDRTLTSSPTPSEAPLRNDALKCLEMSVERNLNMSVASPGMSENSMDDDKKSDHALEEFDENGHRIPRINSHGKIKTFKCKQCSFIAITKFDFWEHQRQHIKPEKLLTCHKCPFVTEYKHHLEYHLRNHDGSKPFKCEHCDYTCVNKSMLNSHKKSHSNIYQYRCAECHYASKYCHSLKLHLRKYNHQPAMVLNPDGSPNPLPIIDVYGTRRGPKVKPIHEEDEEQPRAKKSKQENAAPTPMLPLPLQQLMTHTPPIQVPLAYSWLQQAMIYQNLERLARERLSPSRTTQESCQDGEESSNHQRSTTDDAGALDLSKDSEVQSSALKLVDTPSTSSDEEEDSSTTVFENVEVVQNDTKDVENDKVKSNEEEKKYTCQYCTISFGDAVLYTMHMGYHGYQDPFACNMCGEKCSDKVTFFLHIARTSHS